MSDPLPVIVFSRHNLSLHALLLENQPWFSARDVGRLMGFHLNDRGMRTAKSSTQPCKAKTWCALTFKWAPVLAF